MPCARTSRTRARRAGATVGLSFRDSDARLLISNRPPSAAQSNPSDVRGLPSFGSKRGIIVAGPPQSGQSVGWWTMSPPSDLFSPAYAVPRCAYYRAPCPPAPRASLSARSARTCLTRITTSAATVGASSTSARDRPVSALARLQDARGRRDSGLSRRLPDRAPSWARASSARASTSGLRRTSASPVDDVNSVE